MVTLAAYYSLSATVGMDGAVETVVLVPVGIAMTDRSFRWLRRDGN